MHINNVYLKMNSRRSLFIIAFIFIASFRFLSFATSDKKNKHYEPDNFDITSSKIDSLLHFAHCYIGKPYRSGATGPNSFDCSGFTYFVFNQFGYQLERVSANQLSNGEKITDKKALRPGDLVFFKGRNTNSSQIGHVGIVSATNTDGSFSFIHASTSLGVTVDKNTTSYYNLRYLTACRIIKESLLHDLPSSEKIHTVKKGETLYSLSVKYACKVDSIRKWNKLENTSIDIGQKLKINTPLDIEDDFFFETEKEENPLEIQIQKTSSQEIIQHEVKKGDTLFNISRRYQCSIADIQQWNKLHSTNISIGQRLEIRK